MPKKRRLGNLLVETLQSFVRKHEALPQTNALVIDKKTGTALLELRKQARLSIIPYEQMLMRRHLYKTNPENYRPIGDVRWVAVEVGYRVAYSIEEGAPGVPCHHLSVSGPHELPHPDAVEMLMKMMGYGKTLLDCLVFTEVVEKRPDGSQRAAVNVILPLSGDLDELIHADDTRGTIH